MLAAATGSAQGQDSGTTSSARSYRYIYATSNSYPGNVGGALAADNVCMTDPGYPGTGTYKAMLGDTSARYWCYTGVDTCPGGSSMDWVMSASTEYRRLDGTVIGTTDSTAIINFPLNNDFSTLSGVAWTGLRGDWVLTPVTSECGNWMNTGCCGNHITIIGASDMSDGNRNCGLSSRLLCVEQ